MRLGWDLRSNCLHVGSGAGHGGASNWDFAMAKMDMRGLRGLFRSDKGQSQAVLMKWALNGEGCDDDLEILDEV